MDDLDFDDDGAQAVQERLDRMLSDPMVEAALGAHGMVRGALPWEPGECASDDVIQRDGHGARPAMTLDTSGAANLWWARLSGHSFSYDVTSDARELTVGDIDLPSTTLTALAGRTLDAVAALPGADRLVIVAAVATPVVSLDRMGARIKVRPICGQAEMAV